MSKKNIFLWALYDFANSIPVIVFFLYFSQWLVIDNNVPDIWFNLLFVLSTLLLALSAPIGGVISDKIGVKMPFLTGITILTILGFLSISLVTTLLPINSTTIAFAAILFLLTNYIYQLSFAFYNPLLFDLASEKVRGFISGIGQFAGLSGQVVGLLVTLPLATGTIVLLGHPGRAQAFLPSTIIFIILALPMLLLFKEAKKPRKVQIRLTYEYSQAFRSFKSLVKTPGLGRFLLAYFFFNDALLTVTNNFPIYLEQVFKISDKVKSLLLMGILIASAFGAIIVGWIADKIGLKKTLMIILIVWLGIIVLLGVQTNLNYFIIIGIMAGFFYGATIAVNRAVMIYLSPKNKLAHSFGYYILFERFATLAGPLTWGLITLLLVQTGSLRYQIAMISMAIFVLIGLLIVRKIPAE